MGHPVPIIDHPPVKMLTFYCAQAFWRDRQKLAQGKFKQFRTEREATATAEIWAKRQVGVVVYAVTGNPEADYWNEPRIVATFGEVPPLA